MASFSRFFSVFGEGLEFDAEITFFSPAEVEHAHPVGTIGEAERYEGFAAVEG